MNIVIGGTFGYLHKGHVALISKAFELGDFIYIGLTTDAYVLRAKPGEDVPPYVERKAALDKLAHSLKKRYTIGPLEDRYGPSTTGNFDAIVVSEETYKSALEINRIRKKNGLNELRIIKIAYVLADDLKPISTSRILKGEIDKDGKKL